MEQEYFRFKVCVFGDGGVGKTTLVKRYLTGLFKDDYLAGTMGSFPIMTWIIGHMLEVSIMVILSIILALLGKNRLTG